MCNWGHVYGWRGMKEFEMFIISETEREREREGGGSVSNHVVSLVVHYAKMKKWSINI